MRMMKSRKQGKKCGKGIRSNKQKQKGSDEETKRKWDRKKENKTKKLTL